MKYIPLITIIMQRRVYEGIILASDSVIEAEKLHEQILRVKIMVQRE